MATISQMFVNLVNDGIKASKTISDPKEKALACAELAKALAITGLVSTSSGDSEAQEVAETKEALKNKPKGKQKPVKEEEPEVEETQEVEDETIETEEEAATDAELVDEWTEEIETEEEAATDAELVDEWTEEMVELKAEQLEFVQQLQEEYDEETIDECVRNFSEGVLNGIEEISPLNIDGFVAYMEMLIADAEDEE